MKDSNPFEEWAKAVRETYRTKLIDVLATLSDIAIQKENFDQAITYIDRQLVIDELRERALRQKIEVLALSGRWVEAVRQYREFDILLGEQLGTAPSSETTALYERIQAEVLPAAPSVPLDAKPEEISTPYYNLPQQPMPFIGREAELADLDRLIADPDIRLITIVAPGGMSKTRLVIACAERQLTRHSPGDNDDMFPDGVFFIPFTQKNEVDRIVFIIAEALNLQIESGVPEKHTPRQQVLQYLHQKQMLLLIDSFEHLLEATDLLTDIYKTAPKLKVLVTSRKRLHFHAEQIFSIGALPIADGKTPEKAVKSPAAQLYIQFARHVQLGFELSEVSTIYPWLKFAAWWVECPWHWNWLLAWWICFLWLRSQLKSNAVWISWKQN